jgi:asparagine synthase (glutamine-hydrolysing)
LRRLYPYLSNSPTTNDAYAQAFFRQGMEYIDEPFFAHVPRWHTTRRAWQFFNPEVRASLSEARPYAALRDLLPPGMGGWKPLNRDQYIEAHTLLSGYLLSSQGDRVAMANSVEGRFPFLDYRLIEFANRIPPQHKVFGLKEKYILKQAMRGLIPESIRQRHKQPYRAPDSQSFFRDGRPVPYVEYLLGSERVTQAGYFDAPSVGKLLTKCANGRAVGFADNMAFVGILSTMLVDALFIRGEHLQNAAKAVQAFA